MPDLPPSITIEGDRATGHRLLPTAQNALYRLGLLRASGSEVQQAVQHLPEGSIRVTRMGEWSSIHITVAPGEGAPDGRRPLVYRRRPPRLLSGLVRGGTVASDGLHDFKPTPNCAQVDLKDEALASQWLVSQQLAVTHPGGYGQPVSPGLYTGKMRKLVQVLLGMGRTGAYSEIYDPNTGKSVRTDDLPATVQFKHYYGQCHGLHTDPAGRVWVIYISRGEGVSATPLALTPDKIANDDVRPVWQACRTLFGGIPSGALTTPGVPVLELMSASALDEFYGTGDRQGLASWIGWSFNEAGTEAHNTCIERSGDDAWACHYKISINLPVATLTLVSREKLYTMWSRNHLTRIDPLGYVWDTDRFVRIRHGAARVYAGTEAPPPATIFVGHDRNDKLFTVKVSYRTDMLDSSWNAYGYTATGHTPLDNKGADYTDLIYPMLQTHHRDVWQQHQTKKGGTRHSNSGWYEDDPIDLGVAASGTICTPTQQMGGFEWKSAEPGRSCFWVPQGYRDAYVIAEKEATQRSGSRTYTVDPQGPGTSSGAIQEGLVSGSPTQGEADAQWHDLWEIYSEHGTKYLSGDLFQVTYSEIWWAGVEHAEIAPQIEQSDTYSEIKGKWVMHGEPFTPAAPDPDVSVYGLLTDTRTRFRIQASALGAPHHTMSGPEFGEEAKVKVGRMLNAEPTDTPLVYNFVGYLE